MIVGFVGKNYGYNGEDQACEKREKHNEGPGWLSHSLSPLRCFILMIMLKGERINPSGKQFVSLYKPPYCPAKEIVLVTPARDVSL
jgi:hypothetical protein